MLQLAFLLVGARALRRRWWALLILALALIGLACLILVDLIDGVVSVATAVFGLVFLLEGVFGLAVALATPHLVRAFALFRAALLIVMGLLIVDAPFHSDFAIGLLFGIAFAIDGVSRIAAALVVRFPRWQVMAAIGVGELMLAGLVTTSWPLSHTLNVPVCVSLLLLANGWVLLRASLMLRTHLDEVAILTLPLFGHRNWYDNAPVLVDAADDPGAAPQQLPLTVRVWTPVGSADVRGRRPVLDRYIAAVDTHGTISTGHAALELQPDVYISHYPAAEIEHDSAEFARILRASAENNVKGHFQPSYAEEAAGWCEADAKVEFRVYNPRRLRAYWAGYRQDDTYNLTNRNCSVAVAAGLDSALEGALATRTPWLRLVRLLSNPDLWAAAYLRSRAETMSWTPGLVLDYARTLHRLVEPSAPSWLTRLIEFAHRVRPRPRTPAALAMMPLDAAARAETTMAKPLPAKPLPPKTLPAETLPAKIATAPPPAAKDPAP